MTNQALEIIKHFEGYKLTAYKCTSNVWTIGYGCTDPDYAYEGNRITKEIADGLLMLDISEAQEKVFGRLKRSANGNQMAALISQAFNLSTFSINRLVKYFNANIDLYKDKSLLYNKSNGKITNGLLIRRICERLLFEGRDWLPTANDLQYRNKLEVSKMKVLELFNVDLF